MPYISKNQQDQTTQIFDSFYKTDVIVLSAEFDLVRSFFISVCTTENQAEQYTAFLFRVSTESGIPAIELLEQMQSLKTDEVTINQTLIFYLNSFRPKTNLYGISTEPVPVFPVARNVVR